MISIDQLARAAYEAHIKAVQLATGKAFATQSWEQLDRAWRMGWIAAAQAVRAAIEQQH